MAYPYSLYQREKRTTFPHAPKLSNDGSRKITNTGGLQEEECLSLSSIARKIEDNLVINGIMRKSSYSAMEFIESLLGLMDRLLGDVQDYTTELDCQYAAAPTTSKLIGHKP